MGPEPAQESSLDTSAEENVEDRVSRRLGGCCHPGCGAAAAPGRSCTRAQQPCTAAAAARRMQAVTRSCRAGELQQQAPVPLCHQAAGGGGACALPAAGTPRSMRAHTRCVPRLLRARLDPGTVQVEETSEDQEEYAKWRATTDLREPYRCGSRAQSAAFAAAQGLSQRQTGLQQTGPMSQPPPDGWLQPRRMPRTYLASTRYTGRAVPEAPLIVFINSRSGGHAGPRLTEVLCRALGQAQVCCTLNLENPEPLHHRVHQLAFGGACCPPPHRGALRSPGPGPGALHPELLHRWVRPHPGLKIWGLLGPRQPCKALLDQRALQSSQAGTDALHCAPCKTASSRQALRLACPC